tara:strand:+ start:5831 stop:6775 length:945 start_codon:yes stop_codon:yes gene_type:complete
MTQDNIQQDTPQESTNEQQYTSLEEAVFGNEGSLDDTSSAFTSGEEKSVEKAPLYPEQGQPQVNEGESQNNDDKRYQYWQSQADKYKNELDSVKSQQQQVREEVQHQVSAQPQQVQPEVKEEFPPPPAKPQRPRTYNREEAYSDPNSESARYADELESWRDDMDEYNSLQTQYQSAIMEEKLNKIQEERVQEAQRQQASQKQAEQASQIKEHVMGHYGMSGNEAQDFMTKMSDPKSLNVENLVQLYRMQNSQGNQPDTNQTVPSDTFQQVQKAQQVPSPMGVMPSGQSSTDGKTFEDKVMDNLIGDFNRKNPWK